MDALEQRLYISEELNITIALFCVASHKVSVTLHVFGDKVRPAHLKQCALLAKSHGKSPVDTCYIRCCLKL